MNRRNNGKGLRTVLAPLSGKAVPLEQVPDGVFAQKLLGDGVAIIPEEWRF